MGEIAGIPSFGGGGYSLRSVEIAATPAIKAVGGADGASAAQNRPDARTADNGAQGRGDDRKRENLDNQELVGPSPAFRANVLEMELNLQRSIARLDEARSKMHKAEAEAARAEAEVDDQAGSEADAIEPALAEISRAEPALSEAAASAP